MTPPSSSHKSMGPRSVKNLTPVQLAHKRAKDREAQRAIRARTKDHIESLEAKIEELKQSRRDRSSTADQITCRREASSDATIFSDTASLKTVQDLVHHNRQLEEEIKRLRESLTNNTSPSSLPCAATQTAATTRTTLLAPAVVQSPTVLWPLPLLTQPTCSADVLIISLLDRIRQWQRQPRSSASTMAIYNNSNSTDSSATILNVLCPTKLDIRLVLDLIIPFPEESGKSEGFVNAKVNSSNIQYQQHQQQLQYPHDPHQSASISFALRIREVIAALLTEWGVSDRHTRLALFAHLYSYLAWLSYPTQQTQSRVPPSLVPQQEQYEIPHPAWMNLIRPRALRNAIVSGNQGYRSSALCYSSINFQRAYFSSLRIVNWSTDNKRVIEYNWNSQHIYLSNAFLAHITDWANWGIDDKFIMRYPELKNWLES